MIRSFAKAGAIGFILAAVSIGAQHPGIANAALSCDAATIQTAIAGTAPANTTITSATPLTAPVSFCDVQGTIGTMTGSQSNTVRFEVGLPAGFNGRFLFLGGGGYVGSLPPVTSAQFAASLGSGFATAATDTGHESPFAGTGLESLDGSFGLTGTGDPNLAAREDYAYRGVHLSTLAGEAITQAYYDDLTSAYFYGCSTGGRQALVEAQEFPTDYNGIIAGDPAISNPIAGFNWNEEALLASSDSWLTPDDLTLIDNAVLEECDGVDGVLDGLIQDPRRCKFKPSSLLCSGSDTSNCLTAAQVRALKAIYAGAHTSSRQRLYPGYTVSDPAGSDGWGAWITGFTQPFTVPGNTAAEPWGTQPLPSFLYAPYQWSFQDQFMKYFVFDDVNYDSLSFDFSDPSQVGALQDEVTTYGANGVNPDLAPFFAAGGKLLMYHGWSDPALTPLVSVNYYTSVARFLGGGFKHLQNSARLFMVPGMHHCGGGPGPNVFDPLTPLIGWVEAGQAPADIIAAHTDSTTGTLRTMPLCPYPQTAIFTGGDVYDAADWICGSHTNHRFYPGQHPNFAKAGGN
jgi:Tannase and feruloyl esterase